MNKFKIGDRVIYLGGAIILDNKINHLFNKIGTVVYIADNSEHCSVAFDEFVNGHDIGGLCKLGHGFNISIENLEKYNEIFKVKDWIKVYKPTQRAEGG